MKSLQFIGPQFSIWLKKYVIYIYFIDLSAVSVAVGRSQDTVAVSFPGSATFILDKGHFSLGGS